MTPEEAKKHQDRLTAEGWSPGFWYGTGCAKCCGVYPKLDTQIPPNDYCRYRCEVCGKRTAPYSMPWLARNAWNEGRFEITQARLF
jgi:hypothetical protein